MGFNITSIIKKKPNILTMQRRNLAGGS